MSKIELRHKKVEWKPLILVLHILHYHLCFISTAIYVQIVLPCLSYFPFYLPLLLLEFFCWNQYQLEKYGRTRSDYILSKELFVESNLTLLNVICIRLFCNIYIILPQSLYNQSQKLVLALTLDKTWLTLIIQKRFNCYFNWWDHKSFLWHFINVLEIFERSS